MMRRLSIARDSNWRPSSAPLGTMTRECRRDDDSVVEWRLRKMKRVVSGLALVPILVLGLTSRGLAQLPPAPQPTLSAAGPCPADARFDFDVSSIPNADRARWQIHRAAPGQSFGNTPEDSGVVQATSGSVERD